MSRHGDITIAWGDGEYTFRLGYGELRQIQEVCRAGPQRIADRLKPYDAKTNPHGDNWFVEDIRETIRIGLIGGGMDSIAALGKVTRFVDSRPLVENRYIAWAILMEAVVGASDEQLGKEVGAKKKKAKGSQTTKLPSQSSSEMQQ